MLTPKKVKSTLTIMEDVPPNTVIPLLIYIMPYFRKIYSENTDARLLYTDLSKSIKDSSYKFSVNYDPELQKENWPSIYKIQFIWKNGREIAFLLTNCPVYTLGIKSFCVIKEKDEDPVYFADPEELKLQDLTEFKVHIPERYKPAKNKLASSWRMTTPKSLLGPSYFSGMDELLHAIKINHYDHRRPEIKVEAYLHDTELKVDAWIDVTEAIPPARYALEFRKGSGHSTTLYFYSKQVLQGFKNMLGEDFSIQETDYWGDLKLEVAIES